MERLTKWNGSSNQHAYYPRCFEEPCNGGGCKIEDCPFEIAVCERLAAFEDIAELCGGIARIRALAEADKDGRIRIIPESQNGVCGCCWYFEREPGTKHGTCAKRPHPRDRYGKIDHSKQFIVSQSTQSCRLYMSLRSEAERAMEGAT